MDPFILGVGADGFGGRVVVGQRGVHLRQNRPDFLIGKRFDVDDFHRPLRQGARLVAAKHVDAGERLDAVQLLHEYLAAGQLDRGDRQRDAR